MEYWKRPRYRDHGCRCGPDTRTAPHDIWAAEEVVKLIEEARIYKESLKSAL